MILFMSCELYSTSSHIYLFTIVLFHVLNFAAKVSSEYVSGSAGFATSELELLTEIDFNNWWTEDANDDLVLLHDLKLQSCTVEKNECSWNSAHGGAYNVTSHIAESWKPDSSREAEDHLDGIEIVQAISHIQSNSEFNLDDNFEKPEYDLHETSDGNVLDFPIFILNDPERPDRKTNTIRLLRSLGLTGDFHFIRFTRADTVDLQRLEGDGLIWEKCFELMEDSIWIGKDAIKSHVANAFDFIRTIRHAAKKGYEKFGMFEDDLMLAGDPLTIRERMIKALTAYPATADMLYLESCFENCWERMYSVNFPHWSKTTGPACSAAILFTRKGAMRVSILARQIFWGIDNMYRAMISAGLLEAYVATPIMFFQDGFWGSSMQRFRSSGRRYGDRSVAGVTHRPFAISCNKIHNEWELVVAQVSHETPYLCKHLLGLNQCPSESYAQPHNSSKHLLVSDILWPNLPAHCWDFFHILYYNIAVTKDDAAAELIEIGRWPGVFGHEGVLLTIPQRSSCFADLGREPCKFVIKALGRVTGGKVEQFEMLEQIKLVWHDVRALEDILIPSMRSMVASKGISLHRFMTDCGQEPFLSQECLKKASKFYAPTRCPKPLLEPETKKGILSSHGSAQVTQSSLCVNSSLSGVNIVFDGISFQISSGKMLGINKMWYNIIPFMADIVHKMNGTFTHCQSTWKEKGNLRKVDIPRVQNVICDNLTDSISGLQGAHKIFFSSYYRLLERIQGSTVCNILPIYDFIPERTNLYSEQHLPFYQKHKSIPSANGFLSLSQSTTSDLFEFYGVDSSFVATSPNRVSAIFRRIPEFLDADFGNEFDGSSEFESVINNKVKYLLLIGYSDYSPPYKGYDIFFEALQTMPEKFKTDFILLIIGWPPARRSGLPRIVYAPDVPEEFLPIIYSRASALVYPSRYEGFGMPPLEAIACGCPVILGSFYEHKMKYVYGNDALYAGTVHQMQVALERVALGQVPTPDQLVERSRDYGGDPKKGWNEVAKHYLEFMLRGPFMATNPADCPVWFSSEDLQNLNIIATDEGLDLAYTETGCISKSGANCSGRENDLISKSNNLSVTNDESAQPNSHNPQLSLFLMVNTSVEIQQWFDGDEMRRAFRPWLIPFVTVPRSGTTLIRRVFEEATGLATESEYEEEAGSCQRCLVEPFSFCLWTDCLDLWAKHKQGYRNTTACRNCEDGGLLCKTIWCGCADFDGESSFPRLCKADESVDPILFKTHFPFLESSPLSSLHELDRHIFPGLLLTIRHPLSNFDAWRRFLSDKDKKIARQSTFREFMDKWYSHFRFWVQYSERTLTKLLVVRFEDLLSRPHDTFKQLFVAMGITKDMRITVDELNHAVDYAIDQHKGLDVTFPISQCIEQEKRRPFRIPEYQDTPVCGPDVDVEDILWLDRTHRAFLSKFGYDTLPDK